MSMVLKCDVCEAVEEIGGYSYKVDGGLTTVDLPEGWWGVACRPGPDDLHLCSTCWPQIRQTVADAKAALR